MYANKQERGDKALFEGDSLYESPAVLCTSMGIYARAVSCLLVGRCSHRLRWDPQKRSDYEKIGSKKGGRHVPVNLRALESR